MIVDINGEENSCLCDDILGLDLGSITIFAGENNAGKTKLVKAIAEKIKSLDVNVIHIPAERVLVKSELETGNANDPLRKVLTELIETLFDPSTAINSPIDDIEVALPLEFSKFGVEKTSISVGTKKPTKAEYEKAVRELYVKKIVDSISINDNYSGITGIKPENVGQGTERLMVVALLKYLGEKIKEKAGTSNNPTFIIFEEPEVYLHPKLKANLYKVLLDLATDGGTNINVILTTHDPYFVELGKQFKIYKVFRDEENNWATKVEEITDRGYLPYTSAAEMNYLIFDLPSKTYFLELYEYLMSKNSMTYDTFDTDLSVKLALVQDQPKDPPRSGMITSITRLRHDLAHPHTTAGSDIFERTGKNSIDYLIRYIHT